MLVEGVYQWGHVKDGLAQSDNAEVPSRCATKAVCVWPPMQFRAAVKDEVSISRNVAPFSQRR